MAFASALAWRANFALALPMVALAFTDRSRWRPLSATLLALAALVQLTAVEGVLGKEGLESALLARPFAIVFGSLLLCTVACAPAPEGPSGVAPGGS